MEKEIKCSLDEHKKIDAIIYCPECRIYMCNKCNKTHSSFIKTHHPYHLNKDKDFFTGFCQEKNHINKLEYFCKNHNKLCCLNCIAKINEDSNGQHKDCDICSVKDIKDEKKNKLIDNIKYLEELENNFNDTLNELKDIFKKIEKDEEELKLEVQKIFTKIRNTINEREDELLLDISNLYNEKKNLNEDIINKQEKLPKTIKLSLEKGNSINKEWNDDNLNLYINDCIIIENNIKIINELNEKINECKNNEKKKIKFKPKKGSLNIFLEKILTFGNIYYDFYKFTDCPFNIKEERKYKVTGKNKNILTKTGTEGYWMGTICENELDKSIEEHKWKIKILNSQNKYIMVGIAPIDFDINKSTYNVCGWYYYCCDSTLYSGPPHNYSNRNSGLNIVKNDEIIIIMNMNKRTLKFIINNEDKGDSYNNIPIDKALFPAVLLNTKNDSVEIFGC